MENNICSICLESTSHTLECNHYSCIPCLTILIKKTNRCPICRGVFDIRPYKYNPPRHTPNLKLTLKMKKKLNKFLGNRYLLNSKSNYDKRYWARLMVAYHDYIYVGNRYINESTLQGLSKYQLLAKYLYFHTIGQRIFSDFTLAKYIYAIQELICNPETHESFGNLSFSSFP